MLFRCSCYVSRKWYTPGLLYKMMASLTTNAILNQAFPITILLDPPIPIIQEHMLLQQEFKIILHRFWYPALPE